MANTIIVMLTGPMGSGKSTAAKILEKYGFVEESFAKPIKEFALNIGFTRSQVYGTQAEKSEINQRWGISGRTFMQRFGTELCREKFAEVFPEVEMNGRTLWARTIEHKIADHDRVVISDGRFLDEAIMVKDYHGIIIKLNRPSLIEAGSDHLSETSLNDIVPDYNINNNGTLEELENQLVEILQGEGCIMEPLKTTEPVEKSWMNNNLAIIVGVISIVLGRYLFY